MNRFLEGFRQFFTPLSAAQRVMFVGIAVVLIGSVTALFYWTLQPNYALLFGSVQPDSAQEIVTQLEERGVKYKVEAGGRSIYVESDMVHELRLELASQGMGQTEMKGYELFDSNSLGMTDFMQQVNNKRALEGELARSVSSLDQVETTRVHLVLPERSPFEQTTQEASASVIIKLKNTNGLKPDQIDGITALIAGSVEGLESEAVTILDQAGNQLTNGLNGSSEVASGNLQMQLRQKTETYLTERAQTMLDRVLGMGNSILRVSVEHDFDRLVRESDLIDPDSRMVISEERRSDLQSDESLQQVPVDEFTPVDQRGETVVTSRRENESTTQSRNYEVNKTREVFEKTQGEIKRLTASLLLNHKRTVETDDEGNETVNYEPYSQQEIEEFREIVSLALGINESRGDELSISQIQFFDPMMDDTGGDMLTDPRSWELMIRWGLVLIAFLITLALIFNIKKRLQTEELQVGFGLPPSGDFEKLQPAEGAAPQLEEMNEEEIEDFIDSKMSGKARKQLQQKAYVMEEIRDFVELKPLDAAKVMRALMTSDNN